MLTTSLRHPSLSPHHPVFLFLKYRGRMRNKQEPGIASVEMADMKGFGVVAQKRFAKGDYVCEYSG